MGLIKRIKNAKAIKEDINNFIEEFERNNNSYLKMSTDELIELTDDELYQAVIYRLENKVSLYKDIEAGIESLTQIQKVPYVINYYQIELENGGLYQFFVNSSRVCAPYISDYLGLIGAYDHKTLFDDFVRKNRIDVYDLSSFFMKKVKYEQKYYLSDEEFYQLKSLENKLIFFIREHIIEL